MFLFQNNGVEIMRVNIYAEEMPDEPRLEIITKEIEGNKFTALRIYLELPVTKDIIEETRDGLVKKTVQMQGPFIHRPGDDDSSAVTFWGKRDLRVLLRRALDMLDDHYGDAVRVSNYRRDRDELARILRKVLPWVSGEVNKFSVKKLTSLANAGKKILAEIDKE